MKEPMYFMSGVRTLSPELGVEKLSRHATAGTHGGVEVEVVESPRAGVGAPAHRASDVQVLEYGALVPWSPPICVVVGE